LKGVKGQQQKIGLDNPSVHIRLAPCVFYAIAIAAFKMGKLEQARSITYFK
jgi:hypothetical protein